MAEGFLRWFGIAIIVLACLAIGATLIFLYDSTAAAAAPIVVGISAGVLLLALVVGCLFLAIADGLGYLREIRDQARL